MPRPHTATPHAPSAASAQPETTNGQPSGASLTASPHHQRGSGKWERGTVWRVVRRTTRPLTFRVPNSAFRVPRRVHAISNGLPVINRYASRYRSLVALTTSGGRGGGGAFPSH